MRRRLAKIAIASLVVGCLATVALVDTFQRRLVFRPGSRETPAPASCGLPRAEEIRFTAADGTALHGWYEPPIGPSNGFSILVCHAVARPSASDRRWRSVVVLALDARPAALVLEAPYTSLPDVAAEHFPFLPVRALLVDRFDNLAKVGSVACPLVIIHGDADRTIPCEQGKRLFAVAREPKRLRLVPGADHDDCFVIDGRGAIDEIRAALGL